MAKIEVRFTPTPEDVVQRLRAGSAPPWTIYLFVLLLALMFIVGIFLIDHEYPLAGWLWLALSAVIGLAVYEIPRFQARRAFAADPSAQGEFVYSFNETGVSTTFPTGRSYVEWRAFSKYQETTDLFLFVFHSGRKFFLPKRAMSPEQINELRVLLSAKIPQT